MAKDLSMNQVFLNKLTEILNANIEDENFGVEKLAEEVGFSRSQLLRKLQSVTRQTPTQFIRENRLQKAMELLKDHVATVCEIASRVGFGSATYFNTCFKDFFGYPPGEVKFYYPERGEQPGKESDPRVRDAPSQSTGKKNKGVLYSILGIGLLLATSFILYRTTQNMIPKTAANAPGSSIQEKSIAVLPLSNMSGDPNFEYISDGMTDAIISRLAIIKSFQKVVPFTTMSSYKDTKKSIIEIATELGSHICWRAMCSGSGLR
jgi:AraC-like DNA-binding protein